jgi:hypothetical protein
MTRVRRQRISRIQFRPVDAEKKGSLEKDSLSLLRGKCVNGLRSVIPRTVDLNRPKQPSLPQKLVSSNLEEIRIVNGVPSRSKVNIFSSNLPLKSQKASGGRLPAHDTSFLSKKGGSSDMVSGVLVRKEQATSGFPSVSTSTGRLIRLKATQLIGPRASWHSKVTNRLSCAKRIQLFQALSKEPSCFLDLHVRFGTSKQTIRRLVANGFLREVWGSNSIGVWFKLTDKGNTYLKMLKATSRYDSRIVQKNPFRLKHKI